MTQAHEASGAEANTRPIANTARQALPPTLSPEYPGGYVRIPVANGITFSTGNFTQALLLQYIYPSLRIRTPFTLREFSSFWLSNDHIRRQANELRNRLYYSEASQETIQVILSSMYQYITSKQTTTAPPQPVDPAATAIAAELMRIYFDTLDLTLIDVMQVITESGISLDTFDEAYIKRILNATVRLTGHKNPICLQAVLPDRNIIHIAVEQCRNQNSWGSYLLSAVKSMWNSVVEFFASLRSRPAVNFYSQLNIRSKEIPVSSLPGAKSYQPRPVTTINYSTPFAPLPPIPVRAPIPASVLARSNLNDDDDDTPAVPVPAPKTATAPNQDNRSLSHVKTYKEALSKTLDQYISRFKFSIFGHHHDDRARAVKLAIQQSTRIDNIYTILKRQEIIFSDVRERQADMTSQELQKFARIPENLEWRNLSEKLRWNGFFEVVNYTPPAESGYYQVIQEALTIDPYDASLPIRYGLT